MKKKYIFSLFILLFAFLFSFNTDFVNAKEVLKRGESKNLDQQVVGAITIYDDYTVTFEYSVMLRNPVVKVCPVDSCSTVLPQVNTQQVYLNKETLTFSLAEYVEEYSDTDVLILASAEYKLSSSDLGYPGSLEIKYTVEKQTLENDENKQFNDSLEKVSEVVNKWVIPGIYIVLAVILVVKLVLLSIDIVKYADHPEIRKEKFKGFVYVFVGLLAVGLVNASVGFITGLYD